MSRRNKDESRCLIDHVVGGRLLSAPRALLATTFELTPDFVEHDFLPSLLGLNVADDRSTKARLQLEGQLARLDAAALMMDAECYQGRPCSLRVHVTARKVRAHGRLHAKVTLIVHDDTVRLIVGSANLTENGYRSNREVALVICASEKQPEEAALIALALEPMPELLRTWWSEDAERARTQALGLLRGWRQKDDPEHDTFAWSGPGRPLWQQFAQQWPRDEQVKQIRIVSPFWSEESDNGQLAGLLRALGERRAKTDGAQVSFLTNAVAEKDATYVPELHPSFASYDFRRLGVDASVQAVDPVVREEGFERDGRLRSLHAKLVLVEGPSTTLAYVGSANFTAAGWGLGHARFPNIEAGVVLRREGRHRKALKDLLPPTTGERSRLEGDRPLTFAVPQDSKAPGDWPAFIESVSLAPDVADPGHLRLLVRLGSESLPSSFRILVAAGTTTKTLVSGTHESAGMLGADLDETALRALLIQKQVLIDWVGMQGNVPVAFPVNVATEARQQLPFSDSGAPLSESELVAFYQGRIAFEDMFPGDTDEPRQVGEGAEVAESSVDTSNILSYQIREFVEALPGICQELERSVVTVSSIRFALLGAVSPVTLAKKVEEAVHRGRSPVAGGFQLVELLLCLRRVKRPAGAPKSLLEAWDKTRLEAEGRVLAAFERVCAGAPELLGSTQFQQYRAIIDSRGQ